MISGRQEFIDGDAKNADTADLLDVEAWSRLVG